MNKKALIAIALTILTPLLLLLAINWGLSVYPLPEYGTWTGIQPLEAKLRKYAEFAKQGKVDAVILSSSIGDHGISAETLSQEMSAKNGKPFRAFNLSTGGADFRTYYSLYQILRTIAKPEALYICHPASKALREEDSENSPDFFMAKAPIGEALRNPSQMASSRLLWSFPIVNQSGALRDLLLNGGYKNRKASHFDTYAINEHGDTLNYSVVSDPATLPPLQKNREEDIKLMYETYTQKPSPSEKLRLLISEKDLNAAKKMIELANSDSCKVTLVSADQSVGARSTDSKYVEANKAYYDAIAFSLGVEHIFFIDQFSTQVFEIADPVHMNIHGARRYAQALAQNINKQKYQYTDKTDFTEQNISTTVDPTFGNWPAISISDPDAGKNTLVAKYVQTWQTPPIPVGSPVWLGLRLPDKTDLIASGEVVSDGVIHAKFEKLPTVKTAFILRILIEQGEGDKKTPLNAPLASYEWSKE